MLVESSEEVVDEIENAGAGILERGLRTSTNEQCSLGDSTSSSRSSSSTSSSQSSSSTSSSQSSSSTPSSQSSSSTPLSQSSSSTSSSQSSRSTSNPGDPQFSTSTPTIGSRRRILGTKRPVPPRSSAWCWEYFGLLDEVSQNGRDQVYVACSECHPLNQSDPLKESGKKGLVSWNSKVCTPMSTHLTGVHAITKETYLESRRKRDLESIQRRSENQGDEHSNSTSTASTNQAQKAKTQPKLNIHFPTVQNHAKNKPLTELEQGWLNVSYVLGVVIQDLQPFVTLERPGNKQWVYDLNPSYIPCSDTWVRHILDQLYLLLKDVIRETLTTLQETKNGPHKTASTTDIWTSIGNDAFLGVVLRWWTDDYEVKKMTVLFEEFNESHSGENTIMRLDDQTRKLGVPGVTHFHDISDNTSTDNDPKIVAGFRHFMPGSHLHIRCCPHTIVLSPKHVLYRDPKTKQPPATFVQEAADLLKKARAVVGHFHHSFADEKHFMSLAKKVDPPEPEIHLIQDGFTRWDTTIDQIGSFCERKGSIKIFDISCANKINAPSDSEFSTLRCMYGILFPFKYVLKRVEGEYVSISKVEPLTIKLEKSLCPEKNVRVLLPHTPSKDAEIIPPVNLTPLATRVRSELAKDLSSNLDSKLSQEQIDAMRIASFLDPEHKELKHLSIEERQRIRGPVLKAAFDRMGGEDLFRIKPTSESEKESTEAVTSVSMDDFMDSMLDIESSDDDVPLATSGKRKLEARVIAERAQSELRYDSLAEEVDVYITLPSKKQKAGDDDANRVTWRDEYAKLGLVRLAFMARRKYLPMFGSSAVQERVFSRSGKVVTNLRASLDPETVKKILLLHDNLSWLQKDMSREEFKAWLIENLPYLKTLSPSRASKRRHSNI
eukprot:Lithocolla_globosa_v1_NODE_800_length_3257_cov_25.478763.p1 type:complete len:889 gc:universal NODE_800_length_3257_cov_25.478763:2864-198(-)